MVGATEKPRPDQYARRLRRQGYRRIVTKCCAFTRTRRVARNADTPAVEITKKPLGWTELNAQVTVDAPKPPATVDSKPAPTEPAAPTRQSRAGTSILLSGTSAVTCFGLAAAQSAGTISPELVAPLFLGAVACGVASLFFK